MHTRTKQSQETMLTSLEIQIKAPKMPEYLRQLKIATVGEDVKEFKHWFTVGVWLSETTKQFLLKLVRTLRTLAVMRGTATESKNNVGK